MGAMSTTTIVCDQAIFTSVRTPMGEGYRIIAASRGVRSEEKQTITRFSPSHEALCPLDPGPPVGDRVRAAAFYGLPTKRLCVACSCDAGAEHTGRGGMRVYTHNVVFEESELDKCGFNPFAVVRAMVQMGITTPQLQPPPVLPELQLLIPDSAVSVPNSVFDESFSSAWRKHALEVLLADRSLILNMAGEWLGTAEALLMGLPGPMRRSVSFAAGLRFSVSRCHRLSLLSDDQSHAKSRVAGRQVEYIDPTAPNEPQPLDSPWLLFVERHWSRGDVTGLARRTSRPFEHVSPEAREYIGQLYNEIDAVPQTDTADLLQNVMRHLTAPEQGVESGIVAELVVATQRTLLDRMDRMSWDDAKRHWPAVIQIWRQFEEGCLFTAPLVGGLLSLAERAHPTAAAEAVLALAQDPPPTTDGEDGDTLVDRVLTRLADWVEQAPNSELEKLRGLCNRWRTVRPTCPILDRIERRLSAAAVGARTLR